MNTNSRVHYVNLYPLYAVDVACVPAGEDLQVLGVPGQDRAAHQLSKPIQAVQSGPLPIRSAST
jgi:hypothetical protein